MFSPVMVGGCGQDGHESEAGAQEDPASDVQEAVRTSPRPRPGAHHVPAISSGPGIKEYTLCPLKRILGEKSTLSLAPRPPPAPPATFSRTGNCHNSRGIHFVPRRKPSPGEVIMRSTETLNSLAATIMCRMSIEYGRIL